MSTPERQQDSDPEKVTGYGGVPSAEPVEGDEPVEGSELIDFQPDDADQDDADDSTDTDHKGEDIPPGSHRAA